MGPVDRDRGDEEEEEEEAGDPFSGATNPNKVKGISKVARLLGRSHGHHASARARCFTRCG